MRIPAGVQGGQGCRSGGRILGWRHDALETTRQRGEFLRLELREAIRELTATNRGGQA